MRHAAVAMLTLFIAMPLCGAAAARESVIPMIGRLVGATGREYATALWLTNSSERRAGVALSFLKSGQPNPTPRAIHFTLNPNETRVIDPIGSDLLGSDGTFGGLLVKSDEPIVAHATVASRVAGEPENRAITMSFAATPLADGIGTDDSTILHGVRLDEGFRYKFYGVEVAGHPLYCLVELTDLGGRQIAQTSLYLGAYEQRVIDAQEVFSPAPATPAVIRVRGINGDGRVVFAGSRIATGSEDAAVYQMTTTATARHRLGIGEGIAYSAIALALFGVALFHRR